MLTRGWRLASSMTSQTSMPSVVADQRQLVGEGDVDVAVGVLDRAWPSRRCAASVSRHLALARRLGRVGGARSAQRARHAADDAVVGDHLDHDPAGQHALGAVRDCRRRQRRRCRCGNVRSGRSSPSQRADRLGRADRRGRFQDDDVAGFEHRRDRCAARLRCSAGPARGRP